MALVLVAVMMMAMSSVTAMAATITVTTPTDGTPAGSDYSLETYAAYKIFDAKYTTLAGENTQDDKDDFTYDPDDAAVAYTMATNSAWKDVMLDEDQVWFNVELAADESVYVITPKDDYTTSEKALAFAEYLQENMPDGATATEVTVDGAAATVDPGYYLIVAKDAKDGATKIALVTTDVTMIEKNTYITTNKTAEEAAYQIGDTVTYTATVTIPSDTAITQLKEGSTTEYADGHGPIILHDVMDSALTFAGEIKSASIDEDAYELVWTEDEDADNHTTAQSDGCTFEIVIPVTEDLLGETVTFTYEAEVNSTAVGEDGYVNELKGEINGYKTNPDSPVVYTFDFSFTKVFDDEEDEDLTATFELQDSTGTALSFIQDEDGNYVLKDSDDEGASTVITKIGRAHV